MALNATIPVLLFTNAGRGPWLRVTANGQQLGPLDNTPLEQTPGCYGVGRLANHYIWYAGERFFHLMSPDGRRVTGGIIAVETLVGQSARHLYRVRRGARISLPRPQVQHTALLDEVDPINWMITRSWTLPGWYSTYGYGHLVVNDAETIAYIATEKNPLTREPENCGTIHRFDLATSQFSLDLVSRHVSSGGLLAFPDDSLIVGYTDAVRRYAVNGNELRVYEVGALPGQGLLAHGSSDQTFWVQGVADNASYTTLYELTVDNGVIKHQWNTPDDGTKWDAPFVDPIAIGLAAGDLVFNGDSTQALQFTSPDGVNRGIVGAPTLSVQGITTLPSGEYIAANHIIGASASASTPRAAVTGDFTPIFSFVHSNFGAWVADNRSDAFFTIHNTFAGNSSVVKWDATTGALVREWSGFSTPESFLDIIAVSPDESVAWLAATSQRHGYVYDLVNDVLLTTIDFRGVVPTADAYGVVALADGTAWFALQEVSSTNQVLDHRNRAGTALGRQTQYTATTDGFTRGWYFLTRGLDDTTLWGSQHNAQISTAAVIFEVRLSDNVKLHEWTAPLNASNNFEYAAAFAVVRSMACPNPCENAGVGEPYLVLIPEGTDTLIYDRSLTNLITIPPFNSQHIAVGFMPNGSDGLWVVYDDTVAGASRLLLAKWEESSPGVFIYTVPRVVTTEPGIIIGELGGRRAAWLLDCGRVLTIDRTAGQLIELCLPDADLDPDGVALVSKRYNLFITPLDGVLVDGGDGLLYIDGAAVKVWDLKNDVYVKTVTTAPVAIHWPTLLTDGSFLVFTGSFRGSGDILRYKSSGGFKQKYTYDPSVFSAGLYGMGVDLEVDACGCGNEKEGIIWLPGEEPPEALKLQLTDGALVIDTLGNPQLLPDVIQGGIDTAAAFGVFSQPSGSGFTSVSGATGGRSHKRGRCAEELGISSVSPTAGCNPGGRGWVPEYTGPSGTVPVCADPVGEETLTGKKILIHTEILHSLQPTGTELLSYAMTTLDDTVKKEGRVRSIGHISQALSDNQGNMKASQVNVFLMDAEGRPIGLRLADDDKKYFTRDEITIYGISPEGRRSGVTRRAIGRGVLYGGSYGTPVEAELTAVDPLFTDGGAFDPDKKVPQWTYPLTYYGDAPRDLASKYMPVILGEVSDEGAQDEKTGLITPKGKCPGIYLGNDFIGTAPGGEPWGRFNACLFAIYKIIGLYGSDLGAMGLYGRDASAAVGDENTVTVTLADAGDLSNVPTDESAVLHIFTTTGKVEAPITAVAGTSVIVSGSMDVDASQHVSWYIASEDYVPRRVKLDLTTRNGVDCMVPKWPGYIRSTDYEDFLSDGSSYRVTDFWIRGPLLEAHLAGEATIAFNAIGIEDQGDSTGLPIIDYFIAMNWFWDNMMHRQSQQPSAPGTLWPQTNGQVPVWSDGFSRTKQSSFTAAQALSAERFGGYGLRISAYLADGVSTRDVGQLWNDNGNCRVYADERSRVAVYLIDNLIDTTGWPRVNHSTHVFGEVRWHRALDEIKNYVKGGCDWDPDAGKFREDDMKSFSDAAIARNKGITRYSKHIDGKFIANKEMFQALLDQKLFLDKDGPCYVSINDCHGGLVDIPVGSGILFTSRTCPGTNGFVEHPLIILERELDVDRLLVTLLCLDVGTDHLLIPPNTVALRSQFIATDDLTIAPIATDDSTLAPIAA